MLATARKDFRRLRQIAGVIAKHGYGEWVSRDDKGQGDETPGAVRAKARALGPKSFRLLLEELGPTFIKLGQVLSTRTDLVSPAYIEELKHLQYECSPLSFAEIRRAIQDGLGQDPDALFSHIDAHAIATASVAQVHRATTVKGEAVVIKVQRPGISEEIRADLDILRQIARLFEAVFEESSLADPVAVVHEFEKGILNELDFGLEAANIREFRRHHKERSDIAIPAVYDALSGSTVLTLEFLDGIPFTRLGADVDKKSIARRILREAFDEVFIDGFFHADPHPGNLLLLKDGRYGILDLGICGRVTPKMRETLVVLALAVALKDADTCARVLYRLGRAERRIDIANLRDDLAALFSRYADRALHDISAEHLLNDVMVVALRHHIRFHSEYAMLWRAGATIEGILRTLDPELDVARAGMPLVEELMMERLGKDPLEGGLYRTLLQLQGLSEDVPDQLKQVLADVSAGHFSLVVKGDALDKLSRSILLSTLALSMSILGGTLLLGAFLTYPRNGQFERWGVPWVSVAACVSGLGLFGWVAAYVFFRPRFKKLSLASFLSRRKR